MLAASYSPLLANVLWVHAYFASREWTEHNICSVTMVHFFNLKLMGGALVFVDS